MGDENRIAEQANGKASGTGDVAKRLAYMEQQQALDAQALRALRLDVRKCKRSMAIRTGRIDELRRIVMAEAAAARKE